MSDPSNGPTTSESFTDYSSTDDEFANTGAAVASVASAVLSEPAPSVAETPLMTAARCGDLVRIHALVATGSDVNEADPIFGDTALHTAVVNGHRAAVCVLLGAGANINAKSHNHTTPFDCALINENIALAMLLAQNGAAPKTDTPSPSHPPQPQGREGQH